MCVFLNKQKKNTTNKDSVLFYSTHQYMWIVSIRAPTLGAIGNTAQFSDQMVSIRALHTECDAPK